MVNVIKDNENIEENGENQKILDEKNENSKKISNIIYVSEVQKEIWELQRLKRSLKENKENFPIFKEKIKDLYGRFLQNKKDFSEKEAKEIKKLEKFCRYFRLVKSIIRKTKTEIKKTKNTKREILIIGQTHFTKNGKGDFYAEISQQEIDIFLEYFLDDNLIIGNELSQIDKNVKYKDDIKSNLEAYLKNKGYIKFDKGNILFGDAEKVNKYFENLEMITFFGKQYFKKDDENFFKLLCVYKHYINTFRKNNRAGILSEINYEDFKFMSFGKKIFVNIEAEDKPIYFDLYKFFDYYITKDIQLQDEVRKDLKENFFQNGVKYFLENNLEKLFEKYFVKENILLSEFDKLNKEKNNYSEYQEEYHNEEIKRIYEKINEIQNNLLKINYDFYFSNILKISKNKDLDFNEKISELIFELEFKIKNFKKDFGDIGFINFFEFILKEIYNYLTFTYRETKSIENIEKYFPKNQRQIPIIFGAGHNGNWKEIVEKHNKENPENRYSLKIINFGPEFFNLKNLINR